MTGEPTFFEIGVVDAARARDFYGGLFGWQIEPGPSAGGYRISTPTISGGMHGGDEGASPLVFFGVADLEAAMVRVRELGATPRRSKAAPTCHRRGLSDASRSAATIRAPPSGSTNRPRRRAKVLESPPPAGRR
jgi:predicted enzyme related to lactoylglutathione lyase